MPDEITRARFGPPDPNDPQGMVEEEAITVHFNPNSLQYTITNTLRQGSGNQARQYVSESTGKLTMDLIFDTTDTGEDVRTHTEKVAGFMKPDEETHAPPVVHFEWGAFIFRGLVESYKEAIDFFAPVGVPLRASVNLTLSSQDQVFELQKEDIPFSVNPDAVELPSGQGMGGGASDAAAQGGDPTAARAIGAANGQESLRFPSGPSMTVDPSIKLGAPVAFASGGAGAGIGAGVGLGIGVSGGVGVGIGGGASFGAGAGVGASVGVGAGIGGGASAGVSASEGAFAGLRASTGVSRSVRLDPSRLVKTSASASLATDDGASFSVGGQANIQGSTSLSADVGTSTSLQSRIQFEEG